MFRKIVDVLKEVFWIKPSRKRSQATRRKIIPKSAKKKIAKKVPKKVAKPLKRKLASVKKTIKSPVKEKNGIAKKAAKITRIDPSLVELGVITHYFERIKVCVVKLTEGTVLIGDKLTILGVKTKFVQKVWSLQIESVDVKVARKGQLIGLKVDKLVAVGDKVYK